MKTRHLFSASLLGLCSISSLGQGVSAFHADLSHKATFDEFVVIDANNDGYTWNFDSIASRTLYKSSPDNFANDWLISPEVELTAGSYYRVSVTAAANSSRTPERFEILAGPESTPETFTRPLTGLVEFTLSPDEGFMCFPTRAFYTETDTVVHFAVRAASCAASAGFALGDIEVTQISPGAPEAVSGLTARSQNKGNRNVTLTFVAPTSDITGQPLATTISQIKIMRGATLVTTLTDITPGKPVTVTDTEFEREGWTNYTVIPYINGDEGNPATIRVFIGIDKPVTPANFRAVDRETYVSLYWDPVGNTGENGGTVYPESVYYNIYRAEPIFENGELVQTQLKYIKRIKSSRTDVDVLQLSEGSVEPIWFAISAENTSGESPIAMLSILKGQPAPLPFIESFRNGQTSSYIETNLNCSSEAGWIKVTGDAADWDQGALEMAARVSNCVVGIKLTKVNTQATDQPRIRFKAKNAAGTNRLDVLAIAPDYSRIQLMSAYPGEEYEEFSIDLSQLDYYRWLRFEFKGYFDEIVDSEEGNRILIDEIVVHDNNDSAVLSISEDIPALTSHGIFTLDGRPFSSSSDVGGIVIKDGKKYIGNVSPE